MFTSRHGSFTRLNRTPRSSKAASALLESTQANDSTGTLFPEISGVDETFAAYSKTFSNNNDVKEDAWASCGGIEVFESHGKNSRKLQTIPESEVIEQFASLGLSDKISRSYKFNKKKKDSSRWSVKEERALEWKIHKRRRDEKPKAEEFEPHMLSVSRIYAQQQVVLGEPSYEPEDPESKDLLDQLSAIGARIKLHLSRMGQTVDSKYLHDHLRSLEIVILTVVKLYRCRDLTDFMTIVIDHIHKVSDKSVCELVTEQAYKVMSYFPQTDEEPKKGSFQEIFKPAEGESDSPFTGRKILDCWELVKDNKMMKRVSYLVSLLASLTVCSMKDIQWNTTGFNIIREGVLQEQVKAVDLVDAVLRTVVWIYETGVACMIDKSLAPLLTEDKRSAEFNSRSDKIIAEASNVLAGNGGDFNDFEREVNSLLKTLEDIREASKNKQLPNILAMKYQKLVEIRNNCVSRRKNSQFTRAAFGVAIIGTTSIGKSMVTSITQNIAMNALGYNPDEVLTSVLSESDKYDSTYTGDAHVVIMDDVGNTKTEVADIPINHKLIKLVNNCPGQAEKADVKEKGKVFFNPEMVILTSNMKRLGIDEQSNYPVATFRRFHFITPSVKEKYRKKDIANCDQLNTKHPDLLSIPADSGEVAEVWEFKIEQCLAGKSESGREVPVFQTFDVEIDQYGDGRKRRIHTDNMSLRDYNLVIAHLAREHKSEQSKVVQKKQTQDKLGPCRRCGELKQHCECLEYDNSCLPVVSPHMESLEEIVNPQPFEPQMLTEGVMMYFNLDFLFRWLLSRYVRNRINRFVTINPSWIQQFFESIGIPIAPISVQALETRFIRRAFDTMYSNYVPTALYMIPDFIYYSRRFQEVSNLYAQYIAMCKVNRSMARRCQNFVFFVCFCMLFHSTLRYFAPFVFIWSIVHVVCVYKAALKQEREMQEEYGRRRDAISNIRDDYLGTVLKVSAAAGCISLAMLTVISGFSMFRKFTVHTTEQEAKEKDNGPGWFGYMFGTKPLKYEASHRSSTSAFEHVEGHAARATVHITCEREDGSRFRCDATIPRSSAIIFPKHAFYPKGDYKNIPSKTLKIRVIRAPVENGNSGTEFDFVVNFDNCYPVDGNDCVAAYVPNCPDYTNIVNLLPESEVSGSGKVRIIKRLDNGELLTSDVYATSTRFCSFGHQMKGLGYKSDLAVPGSCMSALVSFTKKPAIVGFHICGDNDKTGRAMMLTRPSVQEALDWLDENFNLSSEEGDFPEEQFGMPVLKSSEPHFMAKIGKMGAKAQFSVLGNTGRRSNQKSRVVASPLSEAVSDVMGKPQQWGGPKLHNCEEGNYKHFNATAEHIANPAKQFDPQLLEKGAQDFIGPLLPAVEEWATHDIMRPLDEDEMINGVAGKRFLEPLPMNTGAGFPTFGKKNKVDPDTGDMLWFDAWADAEGRKHYVPKEDFRKEYDRLIAAWKQGKRAYFVGTGTLKDEPTKLSSEKVRCFIASNMVSCVIIRKYFLPIARFLQMHWELAEMAVGANCFGPEWKKLMNHAHKFAKGGQRHIGWDYSKFDLRMSSQITRRVWNLFIELAKVSGGYSEEDLRIMRMMVVDICHPVLDLGGTMIVAYSINTSGNPLTVVVNGIANALYQRMAYFTIFPSRECGSFRDHVASMTYGDDYDGSVKEDSTDFNFESVRDFLAEHDIKITLPDKSEESRKFLNPDEVEFLKRRSVYIPEIGTEIGCLSEDSIFKSLHANLKSPTVTPEEVAISCMETALHEWFAWGKDHYEMRRAQLQEVAARTGIWTPILDIDFDQRVEAWKEKYVENL